MGMMLRQDDMYLEGLLETLNLRFGSFPDARPAHLVGQLDEALLAARINSTGIRELEFLQEEFELFKVGRPFWISVAALGVGGQWNAELKTKWLYVLSRLDLVPSEDPDLNGGEAIVAALIGNFRQDKPDPVHFKGHDAAEDRRVLIRRGDRPLFYMGTEFLTVSMPFALPRTAGRARPAAKAKPAKPPVKSKPAKPAAKPRKR